MSVSLPVDHEIGPLEQRRERFEPAGRQPERPGVVAWTPGDPTGEISPAISDARDGGGP
jgi:hypothetical protein